MDHWLQDNKLFGGEESGIFKVHQRNESICNADL